MGLGSSRAFLLAASFAAILHAGTIFSTGFESTESPAYSTGQLKDQNGWTGATAATVENTTVFSGSQAVAVAASGLSLQNDTGVPLTYDSITDPNQIVVFDIHFMESNSGAASNWDVLLVTGDLGLVAQLALQNNGDATLGLASSTVGSKAVSRGTWNDFQLMLNFQTDIVSAFVNSQFLGSGTFASASTSLSAVSIGINSAPQTDTGFFDQLSVTSVAPEPGYAGLLVAGIALMALRRSPPRSLKRRR